MLEKTKRQAWLDSVRAETREINRSNTFNTACIMVASAVLAYWAFGGIAHAVLFGWIACLIGAARNGVAHDLRLARLREEEKKHPPDDPQSEPTSR